MKGFCTELVPGANHLINTEEKDPGPPEGFVDNTVYVYKMIDGEKVLIRTEDPFQPGWDMQKKLSRNGQKHEEDDNMSNKYDWNTLWPQVEALLNQGKAKKEIATELGIEISVLNAKIYRESKGIKGNAASINPEFEAAFQQTPTPEPDQAANQEPVQESQESAPESIPQGCPFDEPIPPVNMPLGTELPQERKPYTIAKFNEQVAKSQNSPDDSDFTPEDDIPIPYVPVDIDPVKIELIATVLVEYTKERIPASTTLGLIQGIQSLKLPEVG